MTTCGGGENKLSGAWRYRAPAKSKETPGFSINRPGRGSWNAGREEQRGPEGEISVNTETHATDLFVRQHSTTNFRPHADPANHYAVRSRQLYRSVSNTVTTSVVCVLSQQSLPCYFYRGRRIGSLVYENILLAGHMRTRESAYGEIDVWSIDAC